jgi:chorismate dehydratase
MLHGIEPAVIDFDARERVALGAGAGPDRPGPVVLEEAWPETVLLIGDKVVVDAPPADRYPYQLDLGQAWREATGLPFVYALWACRQDRTGDPLVRAASALLDRQRRHNRTRLDWIAARHAPEHRWPTDLARRYLGEYLRYDVGPREREAIERFASEAAAWLGPTRLVWAEPEAALT